VDCVVKDRRASVESAKHGPAASKNPAASKTESLCRLPVLLIAAVFMCDSSVSRFVTI
jgi:hypothetical protein